MATDIEFTASIQAKLTAIAAEFSGYAEGDLAAEKTFLELGFDSLFLTQLATAFQKEFKTPVTFRQLITDQPTIGALASHLAASLPPPVKESAPVEAVVDPTPAQPVAAQQIEPPAPAAAAAAPATPEETTALEKVFARQLTLMQEQLEILRHRNGAGQTQQTAASSEKQVPPAATPEVKSEPQSLASEKIELPAGFGPQTDDQNAGGDTLTLSQRAHLDRLIARYNAKTAESKKRTQQDRIHHADPRTAAGFNPLWKELVYPVVTERSKGAYLWDVDGNQYIDLLNGFGPNFFGHRADFVVDALKAQLSDGYEIGPQTPMAGDAARLLCELTGMDRVSWVSTGSEAVQAAMRISRTVTGRDKIVVFKGDYHGNFDEVLVRGVTSPNGDRRTMPLAPGIPMGSLDNIIVLEYGEEAALEAIAAQADEIAAVLVEPVQSRRPEFQPREFLHKLRKLTEDKEIVLIFDEVITGFRTCPGGAQEHFGVKADIATYGKIIGGGMPIGVVAGRAKFMDTFDGGQWQYGDASQPTAGVTFFAGTFVRHPMAIAAAHASLSYLKEQGPALQERVSGLAARLADSLNPFFKERGVNFEIARFASLMFIRNKEENPLSTLFFYHMRDRGVHVLEGFPCYMTAAHTDEDVDHIIEAAKDSVLEMQADGVLPRPAGETGAVPGFTRKLPMTTGQRILWSTSQLSEQASCAFNESDAIHIDGGLDVHAFEQAVNDTLEAHEAFKLRFDDTGAYQWVADQPGARLEISDVSSLTEEESAQALSDAMHHHATLPFDLEKGPLVRANLYALNEKKHVFVLYAHHIAFDGYSADIVIRDIVRRYRANLSGETLLPTDIAPYSAYAVKALAAPALPDYWRAQYADGGPQPLDLPTDDPRPERMSYAGATAREVLPARLVDDLRKTARTLGVSMSALTMAAYGALLSRITNRDDIVIGVPTAGQAQHGIEAVGYCVNIAPVRFKPSADQAFSDFTKAVQDKVFDAFEHHELSLSALINHLDKPRESGRAQLVETVFNFAGYFAGLDAPGVKFSARENQRYAVCYDLFFNLADAGETLIIDLDYASDLFHQATIDRWIASYLSILSEIAQNPEAIISDLPLVAGSDNVIAFSTERRKPEAPVIETLKETPATSSISKTEQAVMEGVSAVFGLDEVSLDDNFYDIGGHSIHASRLLTRLRRSTTSSLGIRAIFEAENFRELVAHIDGLVEGDADTDEVEEFLF